MPRSFRTSRLFCRHLGLDGPRGPARYETRAPRGHFGCFSSFRDFVYSGIVPADGSSLGRTVVTLWGWGATPQSMPLDTLDWSKLDSKIGAATALSVQGRAGDSTRHLKISLLKRKFASPQCRTIVCPMKDPKYVFFEAWLPRG